MSGKPAARVTDPTACPLPGHGTNPIVSGSPDVLFDGLPAARQGDPTACGSGLASNLVPNVFINGLPVATLGSLGNHGNVVVGGSGTVIIGNTHTAAAIAAPLDLPMASKICLPCLLLAASRNQTFVPLESLGVRR
ncbi:MAG: PAAR domain-containing protein [Gammaproteobacteria bacterium]|nr:PAAR domain-containing protein [Gammaproteobacteria bacterium]MBU1490295.1 PAAR domain-containing protein [Gammaproteobacteria bacterium]MBU2065441.1 PAAR domain-containing protein [Gammaproteobacteria bacterium]MBU2139076.1 PAAR domain-containing protein [Gammaproteobacteria bacterium]MBU2215428.1 PAAR domain-containing protein [Gammaproteobacteria bacterium]